MLPILTSNPGPTDLFGGASSGAEGIEGEAPGGAFLELLTSMGAYAEGLEGEPGEDPDSALVALVPDPAQAPLVTLHEEAPLPARAWGSGAESRVAGSDALLAGAPQGEAPWAATAASGAAQEGGASVGLAGLEATGSLESAQALPAQEGAEAAAPEAGRLVPAPGDPVATRGQEAVRAQPAGLQDAGQAIRALGGPLAEASASPAEPTASPPPSLVGGEAAPGASAESALVAGATETAGAAARSQAPQDSTSSRDALASAPTPSEAGVQAAPESSGESASAGAEGQESEEPLPNELETEALEPASEGPEPASEGLEAPRLRAPEARGHQAAAARGPQHPSLELPEAPLPEVAGGPGEVDVVEGPNALEAASEGAEAAGSTDLIGQIELSIEPGQEEARIQLNPEALGRVDVRVRRREGRMVATLTVERPETTAEIEAHLPELRDALAERGLELDAVEVKTDASAFELGSGRGQGEGPGDERGDPARERVQPQPSARPKPKPTSARSALSPPRAPGAALDTLA